MIKTMRGNILPPKSKSIIALFWQRRALILLLFALIIMILIWRAIDLQINHKNFLQQQAAARHVRTIDLPAYRGMLLDRNGELLAISTPVAAIWVHPKQLLTNSPAQILVLAQKLELSGPELMQILQPRMHRQFVYLKRHLSLNQAQDILNLNLSGVFSQREYRRYYPSGAATAQVLGFTDIDDRGQEGLELSLDERLRGVAGKKQILQDKTGRAIAEVGPILLAQAGEDIYLSIDKRLQYIAHRALAAAVKQHQADAGAVVILDVVSGEILAMLSLPVADPNNWAKRDGGLYRNRAVTDVFEPGSTIKPFIIALALESGRYNINSVVDTTPGVLNFGQYRVKDVRNYGRINFATILQKSSNVGASKLALSLPKQNMWQLFTQLGFGANSGNFIGEASGHLAHFRRWQEVEHATLAFGYGMSVNLLQLVRAYAVLGNNGKLPAVKLLLNQPTSTKPILSQFNARHVVAMLEMAVDTQGTGHLANIPGFRVAGKTGTVRKFLPTGEYAEDAYLAVFVGLVPAEQPKLALGVVLDNPKRGEFYGGQVAAPLFAEIMTHSLRLLNIAPKIATINGL
jgi:cell division protein FtsI (penicillin-binding protein 3)